MHLLSRATISGSLERIDRRILAFQNPRQSKFRVSSSGITRGSVARKHKRRLPQRYAARLRLVFFSLECVSKPFARSLGGRASLPKKRWCPGEDSNLHALASAST